MEDGIAKKTFRFRTTISVVAYLVFAAVLVWLQSLEANNDEKNLTKVFVKDSFHSHVKELSGLSASQQNPNIVFGVSDAESVITKINLEEKKEEIINFSKPILDRFSLCIEAKAKITGHCDDANRDLLTQWEAIAIDGIQQTVLLKEKPASIMIFDANFKSLLGVATLDFTGAYKRKKLYDKKKMRALTSRLGEGILLMKNGHFLVAKEKYPSALMEFGPQENQSLGLAADHLLKSDKKFKVPQSKQRFGVLNKWKSPWKKKCDLSEVTSSPSGEIYILSQKCRRVAKVKASEKSPGKLALLQQWLIPSQITRPEGLVVLGDGEFIVASDLKTKRKTNVFVLSTLNQLAKQ